MAHPASAASGFSEIVDTAGVVGTCIKQTTVTGETYVVNVATGEKVIPGSLRPDGTMRKPIKVRAGYTPVEERRAFRTRHQLSRDEHRAHVGSSIPGLTPVEDAGQAASGNSKPRKKKPSSDTSSSSGHEKQGQNTRNKGDEDKLCKQLGNLSIGKDTEQARAADPNKRLRNIRKKINEIIDLEKKVASGEKATPEQLEKMGRKAALLAEAADLEKAVSSPQ